MQFKIKYDSGLSVVSLEGDFLSEGEQSKLRDQVRKLVDQGKTKLVIDLAGVKHINSCGLGALVCAFTSVRRAGGDLWLTGIGPSVEELLKITQLTMIFKIFPTVKLAIADYQMQMK